MLSCWLMRLVRRAGALFSTKGALGTHVLTLNSSMSQGLWTASRTASGWDATLASWGALPLEASALCSGGMHSGRSVHRLAGFAQLSKIGCMGLSRAVQAGQGQVPAPHFEVEGLSPGHATPWQLSRVGAQCVGGQRAWDTHLSPNLTWCPEEGPIWPPSPPPVYPPIPPDCPAGHLAPHFLTRA